MGLFDGLGAKFGQGLGKFGAGGGGLLGGAHDALYGTTPGMMSQSNDIEDERLGTLHRAPTVTPTGEMGGGLLDKMKAPDSHGLTFGDKLFAAGGVMQGDSGGAASYLANQRQAADALSQRNTASEQAKAAMDALRGAIGEDGQLDVRRYLAGLPVGADPMQGLKVRDSLRPNLTPMSGPRGAVNVFNQDTGAVTQGVAGDPREAELLNPDGSLNEAVLASQVRAEEALAAAKRRGAPLQGRSARAAAGASGRPEGY